MKLFKSKFFIMTSVLLLVFSTVGFIAASYILPESIIITKENTDGKWIPEGISWFLTSNRLSEAPAMENTAKAVGNPSDSYTEEIYLCGIIPVKNVDVSVIENLKLIPGGESIGINLKTQGVLCVGIADFKSKGKKISPAKDAGVRSGDIFTKINGKTIERSGEFADTIQNSQGIITLEGTRDSQKMLWEISPQTDDNDKCKKIGIWIRESVAGIGTVSFYAGNRFAALGHPITDIDTGKDVKNSGGSINKSRVIGVEKGEKGKPGSLMGVFSDEKTGEITSNTDCGVYGTITDIPKTDAVKIASKSDVKVGKGVIRCDIGSDGVQEFDIEIIRIVSMGNSSKNMIIKVTDKKLLAKTGGIVQGMSGSPILQNGKLIGAVTHVFVNDPAKGYGIFVENMLNEVVKAG